LAVGENVVSAEKQKQNYDVGSRALAVDTTVE